MPHSQWRRSRLPNIPRKPCTFEWWAYKYWTSLEVALRRYRRPYNLMLYLQNLWKLCHAVRRNILRFSSNVSGEVAYANRRSAVMHFCKRVKPTVPLTSERCRKYGHAAVTSSTIHKNRLLCIQNQRWK